ncbi:hypothetical protein ES332_A04G026000v1 [Gossypium tomentosum]|uniref:Uncharacterized protein n=1 Tax=Gossypium tomentosum TaxID=34277 RepID=A0A5D2QV38_GOSTO|nr:hypothetical protein ES332_A04G026000v1 [Gossypium tomentosum]
MACPPTYKVVKGELKNVSDDCQASLNYSSYQGAPVTIKKDSLPTPFAQNMLVDGLYGGLVATKILKPEDPIIWEDIVRILQPYDSTDYLPLSPGNVFSAEAHIHANEDGSLSLKAQIMWNYCI